MHSTILIDLLFNKVVFFSYLNVEHLILKQPLQEKKKLNGSVKLGQICSPSLTVVSDLLRSFLSGSRRHLKKWVFAADSFCVWSSNQWLSFLDFYVVRLLAGFFWFSMQARAISVVYLSDPLLSSTWSLQELSWTNSNTDPVPFITFFSHDEPSEQ